jgi:hypothetical protein
VAFSVLRRQHVPRHPFCALSRFYLTLRLFADLCVSLLFGKVHLLYFVMPDYSDNPQQYERHHTLKYLRTCLYGRIHLTGYEL